MGQADASVGSRINTSITNRGDSADLDRAFRYGSNSGGLRVAYARPNTTQKINVPEGSALKEIEKFSYEMVDRTLSQAQNIVQDTTTSAESRIDKLKFILKQFNAIAEHSDKNGLKDLGDSARAKANDVKIEISRNTLTLEVNALKENLAKLMQLPNADSEAVKKQIELLNQEITDMQSFIPNSRFVADNKSLPGVDYKQPSTGENGTNKVDKAVDGSEQNTKNKIQNQPDSTSPVQTPVAQPVAESLPAEVPFQIPSEMPKANSADSTASLAKAAASLESYKDSAKVLNAKLERLLGTSGADMKDILACQTQLAGIKESITRLSEYIAALKKQDEEIARAEAGAIRAA